MDGFAKIIRLLGSRGVERFDKVALVGGGTLLDACGFALSVYKRGITFDAYPTTLLGMVDASVGGKNSLNFGGKNIVGTFHNPRRVIINVAFLKSLDGNAFMSGLAEVLKIFLLRGRQPAMRILRLRDMVLARNKATLTRLIRDSVRYKLDIVRKDPFDLGIRNILNYGHTIGHAIEAASGYRVSHGYAVAKGIAFESSLLYELGFISRDQLMCTLRVLTSYGYDLSIDKRCIRYLKTDKKVMSKQICVCGPVWS